MRKKDVFEKVLGKEMRRAGLEYGAYVRVISDIRDLARKENVTLVRAADVLLSQQE
jgi:cell division inhibitor SulA